LAKANDEEDYVARFRNRRRLTYLATTMLTVIIVIASVVFLYPRQTGPPIAAIVDQLSSSQLDPLSRHSNSTFVDHAKQLLQTRFLRVDYFSDNATVDNYRSLSAYKLIIWRAHSALDLDSKYVAISTSERYGTANYDRYLENGQLTLCNITGDPNLYFAITPTFVREIMNGRFQDTVIILMSCNGLKQGYKTAESFIEKGAKAFTSWDGWIDKTDNDNAISSMLDYLVTENNTISEAVSKIRTYVSPIYGPSTLRFYPIETSDYRIPDYSQDNVTKGSTLQTMAILKKPRALDSAKPEMGSVDRLIVSVFLKSHRSVDCVARHQSDSA
jgi:hypothetical protein